MNSVNKTLFNKIFKMEMIAKVIMVSSMIKHLFAIAFLFAINMNYKNLFSHSKKSYEFRIVDNSGILKKTRIES